MHSALITLGTLGESLLCYGMQCMEGCHQAGVDGLRETPIMPVHSPQLNKSKHIFHDRIYALRSPYEPPALYANNSVFVVPRFEIETMAYW